MKINNKNIQRLKPHLDLFTEFQLIVDKYSIRTQVMTPDNACFLSYYQEAENEVEQEHSFVLSTNDFKKTLKSLGTKDTQVELLDEGGRISFINGNKKIGIPQFTEVPKVPNLEKLELDYYKVTIPTQELLDIEVVDQESYIDIILKENNITFNSKSGMKIIQQTINTETSIQEPMSESFQYKTFIKIIQSLKDEEELILFLKPNSPLSVASKDGKIRYWLAGVTK